MYFCTSYLESLYVAGFFCEIHFKYCIWPKPQILLSSLSLSLFLPPLSLTHKRETIHFQRCLRIILQTFRSTLVKAFEWQNWTPFTATPFFHCFRVSFYVNLLYIKFLGNVTLASNKGSSTSSGALSTHYFYPNEESSIVHPLNTPSFGGMQKRTLQYYFHQFWSPSPHPVHIPYIYMLYTLVLKFFSFISFHHDCV